jgi:hypothetical protein
MLCTTDTNCGNHFPSSIVKLCGTCSGSDLDRCKFRARVRIDSAGASSSAKGIRGVVVFARKTAVTYYQEGARRRPTRHFAFRRRFAWTHGVSLRRQPSGHGDHQEPHVFSFTVDERVVSSDDLAGTTRHSLGTSVYPQRAQSGRCLFKTDRPRRVGVGTLRSAHAHAASASYVSGKYLAR